MKTIHAARKWILTIACLLALTALPGVARAQDLEVVTDARLEGYGEKVSLAEESNMAMTWAGFLFCSVVALLALFKDAKRSHLD